MGYLERNALKRADPQHVLSGAKSIIVVAASYFFEQRTSNVQRPSGTSPSQSNIERGQIARYAQYTDYHDVMGERLRELNAFIDNFAGAGTKSLWYVDTGPLLERDLAQRAGVGFIGKHTNVISRELGNWFFLAEIITTAEIEPDVSERNRCGTCERCIHACPTNAITAPFQLDARRCISYLTIELKDSIPLELRPLIGNRIYGCDDCLAVCPWNRFAKAGSLMAPHRRADLEQADLLELLSLDDSGFKKRFAGSPILRTKRRGFLRNVCVALGNVADESALPALEKATRDHEPLIVEHAKWAIEQIVKREKSPLFRVGWDLNPGSRSAGL
jgi:epoxyqueuosine reductase